MEALILIFAEILFACLAPLLAMVGALLGAVVEMIAGLLGLALGGSMGKRKKASPAGKPRKPLISRKALHWFAGIMGGVGVIGVAGSFLLFEPILGTVLQRASDKAGMTLSYDEASGSFLSGRVELTGLTVARESDKGLAFEIEVGAVEADVVLTSLIFGDPRLELARVSGVTGFVTPPDPKEGPREVRKKRRPFRAELVQASDVLVEVRPRGGAPYGFALEGAEIAPFRSRLALFDLLFRSNLKAQIAGQPLEVRTKVLPDGGRETLWNFDKVQADRLKLIVPKAPLTWLDGGALTVQVEDRWSLVDEGIDMDWQFEMAGIDVAAPESAGGGERLLASAMAKAVAAQGGDAAFRYRLELSKAEVDAMRNGGLAGFWDVVLSGVVGADFNDPEVVEDGSRAEKAFGKLKSLFKSED